MRCCRYKLLVMVECWCGVNLPATACGARVADAGIFLILIYKTRGKGQGSNTCYSSGYLYVFYSPMLPSFLVAGSEQVLCSVPDKFNANEHVFLLLLRAEMFS